MRLERPIRPLPVSPTTTFEQDPSITVQLIGPSGFCASTTFTGAQTKRNDGAKFQAKVAPQRGERAPEPRFAKGR
jgi:hypothetical protein